MSAVRPVLCAVLDDPALWTNTIKPKLNLSIFSDAVVGASPADFSSVLAGSHPLVLFVGGRQSHDVIRAACETKRVQWVHSFFTGVDSFNLPPLADVIGSTPVSNARGVFSAPLAEHVVLSCLYFNRRLAQVQRNRADRVWDRFLNKEMRGQKMGIVGYGEIASVCAKAVVGLGMNVTGLRRSAVAEGAIDPNGVRLVSGTAALEAILAESDFILNVMPKTADNYHMFNADMFKKMRRDAVFINIGRGATVDEDALVAALKDGTIAGAAIDVFEKEPLPAASGLWEVGDDKLLLTPHNADITHTCFAECAAHFNALATAFVERGVVPEYLVDVRRGY